MAALVAVLVIVAAVADHLLVALGRAAGSDAWLDAAALLVLGVVLGVGAIGGTASAAHAAAVAANARLDVLGAPSAPAPKDPAA